jgi:hypothetical protein
MQDARCPKEPHAQRSYFSWQLQRSLPGSRRICEQKCGWPSLSDERRRAARPTLRSHWLLIRSKCPGRLANLNWGCKFCMTLYHTVPVVLLTPACQAGL